MADDKASPAMQNSLDAARELGMADVYACSTCARTFPLTDIDSESIDEERGLFSAFRRCPYCKSRDIYLLVQYEEQPPAGTVFDCSACGWSGPHRGIGQVAVGGLITLGLESTNFLAYGNTQSSLRYCCPMCNNEDLRVTLPPPPTVYDYARSGHTDFMGEASDADLTTEIAGRQVRDVVHKDTHSNQSCMVIRFMDGDELRLWYDWITEWEVGQTPVDTGTPPANEEK